MSSADRLSPLDRYFLIYESPSTHMHVAGASIFEAAPLRRCDGGLDITRIRSYVEARLARIPRYRQIVTKTPFGAPIWVDDPHFNLEYHVRHTGLPRPGEDAHLKALCGRILAAGADFQMVVSATTADLDARYILALDGDYDGEHIYVTNRAIRSASAQDTARLVRGDLVDPKQVYFRCVPSFEVSSPQLQWLTQSVFVGTGARDPDGVRLRFYRLS